MSNPYEGYKIYGPYIRKDGRKHIIAISKNYHRMTISYPKYLMEMKLGRLMHRDETVDHIDRDFRNNNPDNLQVLSRSDHSKLDAKRVESQDFVCEVCGTGFTLSSERLGEAIRNRERNMTGPYCGKSCAGKASHMPGMNIAKIEINYYYLTK